MSNKICACCGLSFEKNDPKYPTKPTVRYQPVNGHHASAGSATRCKAILIIGITRAAISVRGWIAIRNIGVIIGKLTPNTASETNPASDPSTICSRKSILQRWTCHR